MKINTKKILIGLGLLILWFALTMWYILIIDKSFLVYSYPHELSSVKTNDPLLEGEIISGEVKSIENGFGIVVLRFKSSKRIPYKNEDLLAFRIKEKGSDTWYYTNEYRSGFIYDLPALPFGFPVIENSKNKSYIFELESLKGNAKNAVKLSDRKPVLLTKYQQKKSVVLSSPSTLAEFLFKKFSNSIKIVDIYFSSFVFLLPFIFYTIWNFGYKSLLVKKLNRNKKHAISAINFRQLLLLSVNSILRFPYLYFLTVIILIDVLLLQILNDFLYVVISTLWIIIMSKYGCDRKYSMLLAVVLIPIAAIFLQLGSIVPSEKAASWTFTFLIVWFFQTIYSDQRGR